MCAVAALWPCASRSGRGQRLSMTDPVAILGQANAAFPNLEISLQDDRPDRLIKSRLVGRYGVTMLRSSATVVEAIGRRAAEAGLGNHLKLIWQISGRMRYEDANGAFDLNRGELLITAMSSDYRLVLQEEHEALILAFDPDDGQRWPALARDALGIPVRASAGISAAAGGVEALLSNAHGDATEEIAARAMIDLALISAQPAEIREAPLISRAALHIVRNISDLAYGPESLARDLGMSRRSLYQHLGSLGATPAALIRRIRLDRVRQDIIKQAGRPLIDIAIANGFPDGASLSHAFKLAYGRSPSSLRLEARTGEICT